MLVVGRREAVRIGEEFGGAVTRAQAMRSGITDDGIRARVSSGRWQRILPGAFVTFSGPVPRDTYLTAIVLHAGDGAVLSHHTRLGCVARLRGTNVPPIVVPLLDLAGPPWTVAVASVGLALLPWTVSAVARWSAWLLAPAVKPAANQRIERVRWPGRGAGCSW